MKYLEKLRERNPNMRIYYNMNTMQYELYKNDELKFTTNDIELDEKQWQEDLRRYKVMEWINKTGGGYVMSAVIPEINNIKE